MKKRYFFSIVGALAAVSLSLGAIVIAKNASLKELKKAEGDVYTLNLNADNAPEALTENYTSFVASPKTAAPYSNPIEMKFINAKALSSGFVELSRHGLIYNFASANGIINGIQKMTVTTSAGDVSLRTSPVPLDAGGAHLTVREELTSGVEYTPAAPFKYFILEAGDAGAAITSIQIKYSCLASDVNAYMVAGTYTGVGEDSSTYKMVATDDGNVEIESLDKEHNLHLSGTYAQLNATTIRCTFVYNTYTIYYDVAPKADLSGFTFVAKSDEVGGAAAALVTKITNLYKVYNVDDFESYNAANNGYSSVPNTVLYSGIGVDNYNGGHDATRIKGVRSGYYAQYKSGSDFVLMGSADYMGFSQDGGRDGSQAASFKGRSDMEMRYFQSKTLAGINNYVGKGTYLSMWVKVFTDNALTTPKTTDTTIKLLAYGTTSFGDDAKDTQDVTVAGDGEWHEVRMSLNKAKSCYLYGLYLGYKGCYALVDDVKIFTVDPYKTYNPVQSVAITESSITVKTGKQHIIGSQLTPTNPTDPTLTWTSSDNSVATVSNGVVVGKTVGTATITATAHNGKSASCEVEVVARDYPSGTYHGTMTISGVSQSVDGDYPILIALGDEGSGLVAARIANNNDAVPDAANMSYDKTTHELTIPTSGKFQNFPYGTLTAIYDPDANKLTNVGIDGATLSTVVDNNYDIEATPSDIFFECDESSYGLQYVFKRRVDGNESGTVAKNTTEFVGGGSAVSLAGSTSASSVRLNLRHDLAGYTSDQICNLGYWIYNPSEKNIDISQFIYEGTNLSSHNQIGSVTAKAGQWTYVSMGFSNFSGTDKIYNIQISDFTKGGATLTIDNISLFK